MKTARIEEMVKGLSVVNFTPMLYQTGAVEVAVKTCHAGEMELAHCHKIETELTVIAQGEVEIIGRRYCCGEIIVMEPVEVTDFRAVTNAIKTIVKIPGAKGEKHPA